MFLILTYVHCVLDTDGDVSTFSPHCLFLPEFLMTTNKDVSRIMVILLKNFMLTKNSRKYFLVMC